MFGLPALGLVLALAHYAGAVLVGLIFRFWGTGEEPPRREIRTHHEGMWHTAARALHEARIKDGRPIGAILSDAIRESVATLFMIMSFIVLLSVVLQVTAATGALPLLSHALGTALSLIGLSPSLVTPLVKGVFEIDIGTAASAAANAPFVQKLAVASAIIAWSGLSVHAQVASVLTKTDISMRPYILARALHAGLAFGLTALLWGPLDLGSRLAIPALASAPLRPPTFATTLGWSVEGAALTAAGLLALGLGVGLVRHGRVIAAWRRR